MFTKDGNLHRYAGFKEAERERVAKHFSNNFNLEMLDRLAIRNQPRVSIHFSFF